MIDTLLDPVLNFTVGLSPNGFFVAYAISLLLTLAGLPVGFYFIRHGRIMQDTPTSRIRSASQGFVELEGRARSVDGKPLRSPGKQISCVWYDFKVEERQRGLGSSRSDSWQTVVKDRSRYSFYIDDGTGVCAVDPDEASVKPRTTNVWIKGDRRYKESVIHEGEDIYCLGQFETEQGPSRQKVIKETTRAYLNKLKADREKMLKLFDKNGDGEIDMDEWNAARAAVRAKATREVADDYEPTQHHVLNKPFNKKYPFIVSCYPQESLTRRYRVFSIGAFATFFLAGVYLVILTVVKWGA